VLKINEVNDYIKNISLFNARLINDYGLLLNSVKPESNKLKSIKEKYGLLERESFNFFEGIEKYKREDFNDIVISQILSPDTKEIGNIKYLHIFMDLLCKINKNLDLKNHFNNNVIVEKQVGNMEYGFIDILVSDNDSAIIIESKINGAPDQDNQLARYYIYVQNILNKNVLAIVYIRPVYDENKMPPWEDYSNEYKKEIEIAKNLLVPISIINSKNQMDFCHGFLDACFDQNTIDKAGIYIKQYSDLLKTSGGSKMAMNVEKEILRKLYADSNSTAITNDIGKILGNCWVILSALIQDTLVKEMGFEPDGENYCYKTLNDKMRLTFAYDPKYKELGDSYIIGLAYNSISQAEKEKLLEYLNNVESVLIKKTDEAWDAEDWLIARVIDISLNKPIDEILSDVTKMYKKLENEISSANI